MIRIKTAISVSIDTEDSLKKTTAARRGVGDWTQVKHVLQRRLNATAISRTSNPIMLGFGVLLSQKRVERLSICILLGTGKASSLLSGICIERKHVWHD